MPTSYWTFSAECREWALRAFPAKQARILDVGAGAGKWRDLLHDYPNMDALEVWPEWITRYALRDRYRQVIDGDVRYIVDEVFAAYDLVILGDVLEHLDIADAQSVLARIREAGAVALIAVPYRFPQGDVGGNPHERHVQDDLTHCLMAERYPGLELLVRNGAYGIYVQPCETPGARQSSTEEPFTVDARELVKGVNIAIATPTPGSVTVQYMRSLWRSEQAAHRLGLPLSLLLVQSTADVSRARNLLVAQFMADPAYTHLLFIDSDQGFEPTDWLRLLALDREMIAVAARKKTPSLAWAVNFMDGTSLIERGALEVNEVGTGFLLIRRSAIERMMKEYPGLKIRPENPETMTDEVAESYYALFDCEVSDGYFRSEDLTFCKRWRDIGGRVWVDPKGDITHVGSYEYRGSIEPMIFQAR